MRLSVFIWFGAVLGAGGCENKDPELILFTKPTGVTMNSYSGNLMEPFITRDGKYLLFNNLNNPAENTNLHWATRKDDYTFTYQGEITGVNTADIEGTPSMDKSGNLYFISTRDYANLLSTIYSCTFTNGNATNVALVQGISRKEAGIVNFDVEINNNGDSMYFVDGQYDSGGKLQAADIVMASKTAAGFERAANSSEILKNVNTDQLEYAASISTDDLELFFTRVAAPLSEASVPQIFYAKRKTTDSAFDVPVQLTGLGDFVEAPSISNNGRALYYHRMVNDKFVIYEVRR